MALYQNSPATDVMPANGGWGQMRGNGNAQAPDPSTFAGMRARGVARPGPRDPNDPNDPANQPPQGVGAGGPPPQANGQAGPNGVTSSGAQLPPPMPAPISQMPIAPGRSGVDGMNPNAGQNPSNPFTQNNGNMPWTPQNAQPTGGLAGPQNVGPGGPPPGPNGQSSAQGPQPWMNPTGTGQSQPQSTQQPRWGQNPWAQPQPTGGSFTPGAAQPFTPNQGMGAGGFNLPSYVQTMLGLSTIPGQQVQGYGTSYTGGIDPSQLLASRLMSNPSGVSPQTQAAISAQLQDPTGMTSQAVQDTFTNLSKNIDDQYALQQKSLTDEMARRGLTDSSIGAGRLSDLNIGQRSAKAQMAAQLATQQAQALQQGRQAATAQSMGADQFGASNASNLASQLIGAGNTGYQNYLSGLGAQNTLGNSAYSKQMGWTNALQGMGNDAFSQALQTNQVNQNAQDAQTQLYLKMMGLA